MIFQSSKLRCFYMILTDSYMLYVDNVSFFGRSYTNFHIWEEFPFAGIGASFNTILFFSHLFRVIFSDSLSPYQKTLFLLSAFLRHAVCDVNPREPFSPTVCPHKRKLFPLELFSQTSTFILITSF